MVPFASVQIFDDAGVAAVRSITVDGMFRKRIVIRDEPHQGCGRATPSGDRLPFPDRNHCLVMRPFHPE